MMKNNFVGWFYFLISFMVLGWAAFAYDTTTGNLINQDFTNNSWSGTNQSSRHGNSTIAGVDSKYVESTISLRDTLTQEQINGGFKSTLGADIWFWNNREQSVVMKQTIGGVTQTRIIDRVDGYYNTYTDTIIVNENTVTDYDVNVRFEFNESGNSNYHYAADLKNPTLIVTYWNNPVKPEVIEEIEEAIDDITEWEEQFVEPVIQPPTFVPPVFEETFIEEFVLEEEPVVIETLEELEEEFEEIEILQVFGGPEIVEEPMEGTSNEPKETEPEVAQAVELEEEVVENEPTTTASTEVEETAPEPEVEQTIAQEETPVVAKEETIEEEAPSVTEEPEEIVADKPKIKEFSVDVASVEAQVKAKIKSTEQQLQAVSLIVAKAMTKTQINLGQYTNKNNQMFDNRKIYENKTYNDVVLLDEYMVSIYANDNRVAQITMNDPVLKYQNDLREATFKRQQAERELRKLRGF